MKNLSMSVFQEKNKRSFKLIEIWGFSLDYLFCDLSFAFSAMLGAVVYLFERQEGFVHRVILCPKN